MANGDNHIKDKDKVLLPNSVDTSYITLYVRFPSLVECSQNIEKTLVIVIIIFNISLLQLANLCQAKNPDHELISKLVSESAKKEVLGACRDNTSVCRHVLAATEFMEETQVAQELRSKVSLLINLPSLQA